MISQNMLDRVEKKMTGNKYQGFSGLNERLFLTLSKLFVEEFHGIIL